MSSVDRWQLLFRALSFAAHKHAQQKRKGRSEIPYLNHCIRVADYLAQVACIDDAEILAAALLHDTIEDTDTAVEELEQEFGPMVAAMVMEVTDDKQLPKQRRKQLQVDRAPHKSYGAAQIKLADKLANVIDVVDDPPPDWSLERRIEYLDWTERVVSSLPQANPALLELYRSTLQRAQRELSS